MFLIRFRCRVRARVRPRIDFGFSHQNRLRLILGIWGKESMDLGICTGWLSMTLTQGHGCDID